MTPVQRAAAERLIGYSTQFCATNAERECATLLRELLAEPQRQPLTAKEIIALPEWDDYVSGCCTLLYFARGVLRAHGIGEKK